VADALSHRDTDTTAELAAISAPSFTVIDELHQAHATDLTLQAVMKHVLDGKKGERWRIIDGLIMAHGKVYVPLESSALPGFLEHVHGCGHEGTEKTLH
jgi:hypothetical protein